jgi:hypothetical protein
MCIYRFRYGIAMFDEGELVDEVNVEIAGKLVEMAFVFERTGVIVVFICSSGSDL